MENKVYTYAYALKQLSEKAEIDMEKTAHAFVLYMRSRGVAQLIPNVLSVYEQLVAGSEKRKKAHIRIADERDRTLLRDEINKAIAELGGDANEGERISVDPTLIGGYVVQKDTRILDNSYKRGLVALYKTLTETHNG